MAKKKKSKQKSVSQTTTATEATVDSSGYSSVDTEGLERFTSVPRTITSSSSKLNYVSSTQTSSEAMAVAVSKMNRETDKFKTNSTKNASLAGLSEDTVMKDIEFRPIEELDTRLEGYMYFTRDDIVSMIEEYVIDDESMMTSINKEITMNNFSESLPLFKSYLRVDEYRNFLSELYYSLAKESFNETDHQEGVTYFYLHPPVNDSFLIDALKSSLTSTLYDRVDQKHRKLNDIPSKYLALEGYQESNSPNKAMNMMLDRRSIMLEMEFWFKIKLATARVDGLYAVADQVLHFLSGSHKENDSAKSIAIPYYEALAQIKDSDGID